MKRTLLLTLTLTLTVLGACGDDKDPVPNVDCSNGVPKFADVNAFKTCIKCHASSLMTPALRMNAPSNVNFDAYAAAKTHAEQAASEVAGGDMPPKNSGLTLSTADKDALYQWAMCGTPE